MAHELDPSWDPFSGVYYGICPCECDIRPIALFRTKNEADGELTRRQALPDDDDSRLDQDFAVVECRLVGFFWNNYADPPKESFPVAQSYIDGGWCE